MAVSRTAPTHIERPFDVAELFFSTTNRKGVIVSGNDVFTRVSGYSEAELLDEAHNIIRHPDMPRAVFKLLWDYIEAGRPIAAYVKNMAKDGGYYWVHATVVPLTDGYLSVRLKPTSPLLPVIEALYAELVEVERGIERRGGKPAEAMAASTALLLERLPELGFATYDDFMYVALPTEIRARQAALAERGVVEVRAAASGSSIRDTSRTLSRSRYRQFDILERYEQLHEVFRGKTDFVLHLADNVRLFSLNAQIGAARLADAGAALGVIADIMRLRSDATANLVRDMGNGIAAIVSALGQLSFSLSIATLQSEMTAQFIESVTTKTRGTSDQSRVAADVRALAEALRAGAGPTHDSLMALATHLDGVIETLELLRSELRQLDALQVAGRVESARQNDASEFRVLFEEIRGQIESAREQIEGLQVVEAIRTATREVASDNSVTEALNRLDAWAASGRLAA